MGFDELLQAIGEQACRQRETILGKAEVEAQAILREAAARRDATLRQARAHGESSACKAASRILSQARLQARREVQAGRHEVLEAALRAMERHLQRLIDTEAYRDILGRLLEECLKDADGPVTVCCRPEDRAAVEEHARRLVRDITIEEETSFPFGGVTAAFGPEGRVVCRNTFADRIERIRPLLLKEAARLLFSPTEGARPA